MSSHVNSTAELPSISYPTCNPEYSYIVENIKYSLQAAYLIPPATLYARILYVIWKKHRKIYSQQQFFMIYSIDCTVGLLLLLLDICVTRFFVYIPQLCSSASRFFQVNPLFANIYYPLLNYLHCSQPLIQIFLVLNRLTSVVWPVNHNKFWSDRLPYIILFILLVPFSLIWNTIISKKAVIYYFGGFFMMGLKTVEWASISLFLFIIRSVAVTITVLATVVMFLRMSKMKKRLKSSEQTLCVACVIHSICFMIPSCFEAFAIFNTQYGSSWIHFLVQPFAWDVLNVGSPLIMIFISGQLRRHVFEFTEGVLSKRKLSQRVTVPTGTSNVSLHI